MGKNFYQLIRSYGGISLEYISLQESDFAASAGTDYNPPERGDFRRISGNRQIQLLGDAPGVVETFHTDDIGELFLPANTVAESTNDAGNGRIFFIKNSGSKQLILKDYLGTSLDTLEAGVYRLVLGNNQNNWDIADFNLTALDNNSLEYTNIQTINFGNNLDVTLDSYGKITVSNTLYTGPQGYTGLQGITGLIGPTGLQGVTGVEGYQGSDGATGIQGVTGLSGYQGSDGATGIQGVTGLQGLTGLGSAGYGIFAYAKTDGAGNILEARNLNVIRTATGTYEYSFITKPNTSNYAVAHQYFDLDVNTDYTIYIDNTTVDGFKLTTGKGDNGTSADVLTDITHSVVVFGPEGPDGLTNVYDIWLSLGYTGTEQDFINSLRGNDNLAMVQVRNTNNPVFNDTWTDISWNLLDVETEPALLKYDTNTTTRILIGEDGDFLINYNLSVEPSSSGLFSGRVFKNNSTEIKGSNMEVLDGNDEHLLSNSFVINGLIEGDFLTFQLKKSTGDAYVPSDIVFNIVKLNSQKGEKGATGLQGPAGGPQGETGIQGVTGIPGENANAIFGSEFQTVFTDTDSSTTSTSPVNKISLYISNLPAGKYRVGWQYKWRYSYTKGNFIARVQVDDSLQIHYLEKEPKDSGSDIRINESGFAYVTFSSQGDHFFDLDYWGEGDTSYIYDAALEFWRVE